MTKLLFFHAKFLFYEIYKRRYFQITDEEGNPIPLSIQEARQLLSEGHFISQLSDGQTIRVHSGMLTQQLPQALNIHVDEQTAATATMKEEIVTRPNATKSAETMSMVQTDADAIVKALEVIF